jgi:uncharacterized protein (DUF433 family)
MTLSVEQQPIPLVVTAEGVVRIEGTRVPLETVVRAFHQGATAEEITQDYPTLTLAQVYAVLAYYLWHCEAVDTYIAERALVSDASRAAHEARFDPTGIRARLLARQAHTEHAASVTQGGSAWA